MRHDSEAACGRHGSAFGRKRLQCIVVAPVKAGQGERKLVVDKAFKNEGGASSFFHGSHFKRWSVSKVRGSNYSDLYLGDRVGWIIEVDMQKRFRINTTHLQFVVRYMLQHPFIFLRDALPWALIPRDEAAKS